MGWTASSHVDGRAVFVFHLLQRDDAVAAGVNDFNAVADGEFVFGFNLGPAVIHATYFADKLAAVCERVAGFVVLVVVGRAAVHQACGVATVGQAFEFGDELGVERAACHSIVNRAAVHLRGARHVVQALGAAFDLEGVHANFGEALHVLHRTQVLAVHDVGAVLVFHDGHELTGAALFFEQVNVVGGGVALAIAAGREA